MSDEIISSLINAGATFLGGILVFVLSLYYYKHSKNGAG